MVFSIFNAIMLEVYLEDGIKVIRRSEVVPIFTGKLSWEEWSESCDGNSEDDNRVGSPFETVCRRHLGFISLQNFFNVAANRAASRDLAVFGRGCLLTEIYTEIIANSDFST